MKNQKTRSSAIRSQFTLSLAFLLGVLASVEWLAAAPQQFGNYKFGGGAQQDPVAISARLLPESGSQRAIVEVTATIAPGQHIYSTTQKKGKPSIIDLKLADAKSEGEFKRLGPIVADRSPVVHDPDPILGYRTEEFEDEVVWQIAIEFGQDVEVGKQSIVVTYNGLACATGGSCVPVSNLTATTVTGSAVSKIDSKLISNDPVQAGAESSTARQNGDASDGDVQAKLVGETSLQAGHGVVRGEISKPYFQAGQAGAITFSVDLEEGYHTYKRLEPEVKAASFSPTYLKPLAVWPETAAVEAFEFGVPTASSPPVEHVVEGLDEPLPIHEQTVSWRIDFVVPQTLPPGEYLISGVMQVQTCSDVQCDPPLGFTWQVPLKVGSQENASATLDQPEDQPGDRAQALPATLSLVEQPVGRILTKPELQKTWRESLGGGKSVAGTDSAAGDPFDLSALSPQPFQGANNYSIPAILAIALFGGFLLNFMPCVLPVIGLKILSLVEQAGESRARAFTFNTVYVLGMMSVFWILALLISSKEFGWGSQFSSTLFNIVFSGVVFAMALSYLEVWEITLPGFVGTQSTKLEQKDGLLGTFFKGVVTTILATPCSGPGLATALAWCADKPAWLVLVVFTFLGLGMGLPYLLVAVYPPIISFLPKPGAWMNTFKQVMGFVLLGTVAFFLSYIDMEYLFPTLCFLLVLWFACWLVGRLSFLSSAGTWVGTWASALLVVLASSYFIFGWQLTEPMNQWLGGKFNQTFASDWNLRASQTYRLNSFVDRQLSERSTRPVSATGEDHRLINWQPFSMATLKELTTGENRKTVFIDFTAEWCANCKVFERVVLHNEAMAKRLNSPDVVALIADKTMHSPEIDALLVQLNGGVAIPLYAVFPQDDPGHPIVLDASSISFNNVNESLDLAGVPSVAELGAQADRENGDDTNDGEAAPPLPLAQHSASGTVPNGPSD